jgi:putative ABC transport system permease protein
MGNLYLLAFRNLWVRKSRTFFTLSGVALGVALVLAVSILNASANKSFESFFAQASGNANLTIADAASMSAHKGFRASLLHEVRAFPNVINAVGMTTNSALLLGKDNQTTGLTILGIDPAEDAKIRVYELAEGRLLSEGERAYNIVLPKPIADKREIHLGDKIELMVGNETLTFTVIGLLADKGAARIYNGAVGFVTLDVSREVFQRGSKFDQIDLVADPAIATQSEKLDQLRADIQARLGDNYTVDYPSATGKSISDAISGLTTALGMFTVIALIVSALLTYNTFSMIALERTREWGLLRSLGTGRSQLLRLVLIEAVFMALFGTGLGLVGGVLLAVPLSRMMSAMFGGLTIDQMVVPPAGVVSAAVSGVLVTLFASFVPAWGVTRITPMEALRVRSAKREGFLIRHGWKLGLVLLVVFIANEAFRFLPGSGEFSLILAFSSVTLLVPITISLLERIIRYGMSALYGMPGRLGSLNIQRNKSRATLTVSVIVVGAAMTIGMGGMQVSFKAELERWIDSAVGGDFWISGALAMRPEVGQRIAQTFGIGAITPERWMYVNVTGVTISQAPQGPSQATDAAVASAADGNGFKEKRELILFRVIDPATRPDVTSVRFSEDQDKAVELWNDFAAGDAVLVAGYVQQSFGLKRGDLLRIRTARGEHDFRVAGIVTDILQGGRSIMGSWSDMRKYFGQDNASFYIARLAPGADAKTVEQRLKDDVAKSRHLTIQSGDEWRAEMRRMSLQFFTLFDAIVYVAVIVGALGVVNTMTMSVLERTREIGMLRGVGMTRTQVTWMVLAEAAAMGVIAALFGVGAGLGLSFIMVTGMKQGTGWSVSWVFPAQSLYVSIVIALVVSQVAAIYPTWRAVRTVIVETIKHE